MDASICVDLTCLCPTVSHCHSKCCTISHPFTLCLAALCLLYSQRHDAFIVLATPLLMSPRKIVIFLLPHLHQSSIRFRSTSFNQTNIDHGQQSFSPRCPLRRHTRCEPTSMGSTQSQRVQERPPKTGTGTKGRPFGPTIRTSSAFWISPAPISEHVTLRGGRGLLQWRRRLRAARRRSSSTNVRAKSFSRWRSWSR